MTVIFANSFVLMLGAALLAIPVVLHFLMQPKHKVAVFPAMRFLQEQHHATKRQLQIRHWILLGLRALIILLLALALAGPSVAEADFGKWLGVVGFGLLAMLAATFFVMSKIGKKGSQLLSRLMLAIAIGCLAVAGYLGYRAVADGRGTAITSTREPVTAMIILDNSPRMTYVRENTSNLVRGQEMARWILSQLPPDSQVSVADLSESAPFYSVDFAAAKKRVDTIEVGYLTLSIPEVTRRGIEFLKNAIYPRKEIYIVSDLTRPGWASAVELAEKLKDDTSIFIIDVGTPKPINVSINDMKLESHRLTSASKVTVNATLVSSGQAEQREIQLSVEKPDKRLPVFQDGKTVTPTEAWVQTESVIVPANGNLNISIQLGQSLPPGVHHGSLKIVGGDGLEIDNQRFFTVDSGESWRVLIAAPPNVFTTSLTSVFESDPLFSIGAAQIQYEETPTDKILDQDLSKFNAVFVLDPQPIPEDTWKVLKTYVSQGGGLGIFLGNNARRGGTVDASFNSETAKTLIGGEITNLFERPFDNADPLKSLWYFSPNDMSHPIFKGVRGSETRLPWHQYPVFYHWGVAVDAKPELPTQVILQYNNREPAIIERSVGIGRVMTFTTPITETRSPKAWNRLVLGQSAGDESWAMFSILKQMSFYLCQVEQDTLNVQCGQIATLKNDLRKQPDAYSLFTPNLTQTPTRIAAANEQVRYKFTDQPGHYRLKGSKDDAPVTRGFSSNLPTSATDLVRIEKDQLDKVFGVDRYQLANDKIEIERQQGTSRKGQEFYPLIVIMLCIVFGMEYIMSNRFYNRPAGKPGQTGLSASKNRELSPSA